jgi:hypothetical protein
MHISHFGFGWTGRFVLTSLSESYAFPGRQSRGDERADKVPALQNFVLSMGDFR